MLPNKYETMLDVVGELDSYLKKLLCIEENSQASAVLSFGFDFLEGAAPVIGNVIQNVSIRNLKKGLKELNSVVANMSVTLNEHQEKFIQEKALPLILKKLMQEEQEEKVKLIINGFESILIDLMYEEDPLYEFYDVLDSLRKKEIARMLQIHHKETHNQETYNVGNFEFDGTSIKYIDNKLEQLGLKRPQLFMVQEGEEDPKEITEFGYMFISFFRNRNFTK